MKKALFCETLLVSTVVSSNLTPCYAAFGPAASSKLYLGSADLFSLAVEVTKFSFQVVPFEKQNSFLSFRCYSFFALPDLFSTFFLRC